MRALIVARRVLTQLRHDHRFLAVSLVAPLMLIFLLKIFFDTMPSGFNVSRYIVPIAAFIIHFLAFLLCAIVLVQERTIGTMDRMIINGFRRIDIIGGYLLGYTALATVQSALGLTTVLWLFDLGYSFITIAGLFGVIWLLAITSVVLGMLVSTFARHEGQVFPFIPLIIVPGVFLSGMIIDIDKLPTWATTLGYLFPLTYANTVIQELIGPETWSTIAINAAILAAYGMVMLGVASKTLREVE